MARYAAVILIAAVVVGAAPYLARLTLSVPDRNDNRWWTGRPASIRRVIVVAVIGLPIGALAGSAAGWSALLPAYLVLALTAVPLTVIDVEHHRLPDRLVAVAAIGGAIGLTIAAATSGQWADLGRATAATGLVAAIGTVLTLIAPFGFGDTKLGAVLAGYLGSFSWTAVLAGFAAGFLLAALVTIALVITRRVTMKSAIPLGPALIAGALAVAAAQQFG